VLTNLNIIGKCINHNDIQPVGRFSLLIQTWLSPESKHEFSYQADRNPLFTTEQMAFWAGVYPKPQGCLIEKTTVSTLFRQWCTHFQRMRGISVVSV